MATSQKINNSKVFPFSLNDNALDFPLANSESKMALPEL